jgi:rod shape-determining protein MreC
LKKLLSISNEIKYKFITAKIISKSNLSFIRSSILMSGKKDNILLSSPVIYNNTLLGYINEVGFNSSRVLSLTDINVKAPAVILGKDVKVILAGNNSKYLDILNYLDISSLKSGDKVFTSGDGNMYPAGLYIGKVKIKLNGSFVVEPAENLNNLSYVQIINWKPEERGIDINIDPIFYE